MAHFDYLKPGNVWGLFTVLGSALMKEIDARIYKSINGDEGGTWAPHTPGSPIPTPIRIGGDGLEVTGPFVADDADVTIQSGRFLTVQSGGTVDAKTGSVVKLDGATTIGGITTVQSSGTLASAGTVAFNNGTFTIGGSCGFTLLTSMVLGGSAIINITSGTGLVVGNLGNTTWANGSIASHQNGSTATFASGSMLNINGSLSQGASSAWTIAGSVTLQNGASFTSPGSALVDLFQSELTLVTLKGKVSRTTVFQDNLRYVDAPSSDISIAPNREIIEIPSDLGGSNVNYKILNPLLTLQSNECVIIHIFRPPSVSTDDAIIKRSDNTVIGVLKGTTRPKSFTLVWTEANPLWRIMDYSGVYTTDIA